MGGFAIDLDYSDAAYANLFGKHKRLTLTAKGVSLLGKCGRLPNISAEDVRDKNKMDSLAKGLHKPRQVESPTILSGEWVLPLLAYMFSASRISSQSPPGIFGKLTNPIVEMKQLIYFEEQNAEINHDEIAPTQSSDPLRSFAPNTILRAGFQPRALINTSNQNHEAKSPYKENEWTSERRRLAEVTVSIYPAIRTQFKLYNS
ncbi:hypothetical protein CC78DRAFT_546873 [Lojkania enalia]|uniref:Uncharacterized protein n=1 Tax=Lojkania enalia TaxID=147567 RepID=A0A9P4MXE0_9PLEO|nr:hypothetical protein CC78DRAFT_546873 [Didymosphaeria enalia]